MSFAWVGAEKGECLPDKPMMPPSVHFEFELFQSDHRVTTVVRMD